MKKAVIYIHGKKGNVEETEHYKPFFEAEEVIGLDYKGKTPWETREEFGGFYESIRGKYQSISIIGNSIGAYFAMNAFWDKPIESAMFISPIVNMEKLVTDMMLWSKVSEEELKAKKNIDTAFGEMLSWDYLCYVRDHPVKWSVPTVILYGEKDNLTSYETMEAFAKDTDAKITVMKDGEHWFHTEEQMRFLDGWLREIVGKE